MFIYVPKTVAAGSNRLRYQSFILPFTCTITFSLVNGKILRTWLFMICAIVQQQTNDARAAEGRMSAENKSSEEPGGRSNSATVLHNAIDSIGSTRKGGQGKSLLSLAIGSGDISVVEYVIMLDYYQKTATTKEVGRISHV